MRIGSAVGVRWDKQHHIVARPDAAWFAEVITHLKARPDVLRHLPVVANNLGFVRGDRLVIPCQHRPGVAGEMRPADVSVRHTRAVQTVIQAAQSPITIGELIGKLAADLPGKPLAKIERMLTELVSCRVLVTSLHFAHDGHRPAGSCHRPIDRHRDRRCDAVHGGGAACDQRSVVPARSGVLTHNPARTSCVGVAVDVDRL